MANPFFIDSEANPNEPFGARACSFAGQQKSPDCSGPWRTWHSVPVGRPQPRLTVCHYHLREAAADLFVTPKVTERKPKRAPRREVEAELSL